MTPTMDRPSHAQTDVQQSGRKASVERLYPDDFARVHPLLARHDPSIVKEKWLTLFDYGFEREEEHCGLGLVDGGRVVGYLGLIFSQRRLEGKLERFCNTTSWVVDEDYRHQSLELMLPVLRLKEHTLTDFTPAPEVARWCVRWGFKELDTRARILWTRASGSAHAEATIIERPEEIAERLSADELQIMKDHQPFSPCQHLLAEIDGDTCYVLFTRVPRSRGLSYSHVLYVSDTNAFARHSVQIRRAIAWRTRTRFVAIDERHVNGLKLPRSHTVTMSVPRYYRGTNLNPEQVDNLYSEMAMLGLSSYSVPFPSPWEARPWKTWNQDDTR